MKEEMINTTLVPGNACFGCGHENPRGLHIEVFRDPENDNRLKGTFSPSSHMTGFPGITHGGALYTALDCIAAWAPMALRRHLKALWVLRSAEIRYLRPAKEAQPVTLSATIIKESADGGPADVRAKARNPEGKLLVRGTFKVVPMSLEQFKKAAGSDALPDNWRRFVEEGGG